MKSMGWLLFVLGILMVFFRGTLLNSRKNMVNIGSLEINRIENHHVGWPVYTGSILILAGGIMVIAGSNKKKTN